MIEQNVQVIRCQDDRIWVRLGSSSGCTACDNGKGCGAGIFARLVRRKPVVLELPRNQTRVERGQMLVLAFPERIYLKLVWNSYGWPLLAALAGAAAGNGLGSWLQFSPGVIDVCALFAGLLTAFIAIRLVKNNANQGLVPASLRTMVYYPAANPNMCNESRNSENTV
ncbi:MAG: hypothetical protein HKP21_05480 [Xanthomonadales bacterium]|nr:SoxR reducing system RseC family protein [Gammaproteobacteria bacterium]MBT8073142.1 SoxR reducing system RseC family protein [Gammaproteobacteria bacterium]NNK03986.1 hypothetical protein [Xanthomonadales bacterium]NNL00326.1 hypothetical protein [Xanthomonadales bacterium]